jgi:hypothetical protein
MPLIPGAVLTMNSAGVVSGTDPSMALARGLVHAEHFVAPALVALDAAIAAEEGAASPDAAAIAALEDQKLAIVAAWNDAQAPYLLADAAAICEHVATNLRMTFTDAVRVQRIPDPATAFAFCEGPNAGFPVDVDGAFS